MRLKEVDDLSREGQTPDERAAHDRRRSEMAAALRAGIAIRDAREEAGLSQTQLAGRIGIAQSALSRIEAGRSNLTLASLQRIASALGVDLTLEVGSQRALISA
jgi:ribosome-binding protein aMBF1 (putative translation factor)